MIRNRQLLRLAIGALGLGIALLVATEALGQMRESPYGRPYGWVAGNPAKGKQIAASKCASCHGPYGNSPNVMYPKLAGQDPVYLYRQLFQYQSGARKSDIMAQIAGSLTAAEAADVSTFYAQQAIKPDKVQQGELARLGQRIFYGGKYPSTPACVNCHNSPRMAGTPFAMGRMGGMGRGMMGRGMMQGPMMGNSVYAYAPYLDGQHADYLVDQLNKFADSRYRNPNMRVIAAGLSDEDRKALAAFLSGLP